VDADGEGRGVEHGPYWSEVLDEGETYQDWSHWWTATCGDGKTDGYGSWGSIDRLGNGHGGGIWHPDRLDHWNNGNLRGNYEAES
jgi:hypothetical protein